METPGREVHIDQDEARAGSTPGIVRYILLISLVLAIVALTVIWVTGAATSNQDNNNQDDSARAVAEQQARQQQQQQ